MRRYDGGPLLEGTGVFGHKPVGSFRASRRTFLAYMAAAMAVWSLSVAGLLLWDIRYEREGTRRLAMNEARAYFNKDQAIRLWVASHGGVYVLADDRTPPNPYLGHVAERDIVTPSGRRLTLMNSAYLMRHMMGEYSGLFGGSKWKITSLKPLRKENSPDGWERNALESFATGVAEAYEFTEMGGEPYLRYMRALLTEEECLKCHAFQGYKAGDVRGGVGIALPLDPFTKEQRGHTRMLVLSHFLIWALGMAGIAVGAHRVGNDIGEMESAYGKLNVLEQAIRTARVGMTIRDTRNRIWYTNPAEARMHGYEVEELIGREVGVFSPSGTVKTLSAEEMKTIEGFSRESMNVRRDGSVYPVHIASEIIRDHGGDPIGIVAVSEDITERKALEEKVRKHAETLEEKVRERTREFEHARQEAESANRAKSEFLTSMSHELRTPLNSVIGFAELMLDGFAGSMTDKQKEYTADIMESGNHLLSLINDILDISKVEAGKMEFDLAEVALKPVIERTLTMFREKALKHNIRLGAEVPDDMGTVTAEERRVKQILFNLIGNAVKFTPDGGKVGVRVRRTAGEAVVEVWDTGVGISEGDMARIFNPFERADSAWAKEREGTGLGLHVTKKFVELHGGRIWAESEPGRGSRFTFTIPLKLECKI